MSYLIPFLPLVTWHWSLCLWWRWRVTIHYHGKCKMDYLSKAGNPSVLDLIFGYLYRMMG